MNCLSEEMLLSRALDATSKESNRINEKSLRTDFDAIETHLAECAFCRGKSAYFEMVANSTANAHRVFSRGHEKSRKRLLASLSELEVDAATTQLSRRESPLNSRTKRRRISIGVALASIVAVIVCMFCLHQPANAFAQVAEQLRRTKSFRCKTTSLEKRGDRVLPKADGMFYWSAPNSYRTYINPSHDSELENDTDLIHPAGKPGMYINHRKKTFANLPTRYAHLPTVFLIDRLAQFSGRADRELGTTTIAGKVVIGFEVAANKISPDLTNSTVRVWFDPQSRRPIVVEYETQRDEISIITRMDGFAWDEPADDWFNISIPAGYRENIGSHFTADEITSHAITALKTFAKYNNGRYPQVKMIYGDVTRDELFRNAGIPLMPKTDQERNNPAYGDCLRALTGLTQIYGIQQDNPDPAYYGKEVGPDDTSKILLRWRLDNGEYRVIFGDLHFETVSSTALRMLEAKQ